MREPPGARRAVSYPGVFKIAQFGVLNLRLPAGCGMSHGDRREGVNGSRRIRRNKKSGWRDKGTQGLSWQCGFGHCMLEHCQIKELGDIHLKYCIKKVLNRQRMRN